jgi:hypothetical protein
VVTGSRDSIARLVELLLEHDTVEADGIVQCFAEMTTTANIGMNVQGVEQTNQIGQATNETGRPSNFPTQSVPTPQTATI